MPRPARQVPWVEPRNGVFYAHWYDAGEKRVKRYSLRTADPTEAQDRFVIFLRDGAANPQPARDAGMSVADVLDLYYNEHVVAKCADWKRQDASIRHLKQFFIGCAIGDVDAKMTRQYAQARANGVICGTRGRGSGKVSAATIHRELNTLVAAANHCAKWRHIPKTDVPIIDRPQLEKAGNEEALWFTKDEIDTLIGAAEGQLRDFIVLAYYTAARRASIEYLRVEQVSMASKRINLMPPGGRQTKKRKPIVPIYPEMEATLERLIAGRKDGYLFGSPPDFYRPFRQLCERLGFTDKYNPHMLRHSRATHLLQAGWPIWKVGKLLGDTVATVERVYGHHCVDYLGE